MDMKPPSRYTSGAPDPCHSSDADRQGFFTSAPRCGGESSSRIGLRNSPLMDRRRPVMQAPRTPFRQNG